MTKIKLIKPVIFGSDEIKELEFREPVAKDLRKLTGNGGAGEILDLAARLCGQTPPMIDMLSIKDTKKVLALVSGFLADSQETGNQASEP